MAVVLFLFSILLQPVSLIRTKPENIFGVAALRLIKWSKSGKEPSRNISGIEGNALRKKKKVRRHLITVCYFLLLPEVLSQDALSWISIKMTVVPCIIVSCICVCYMTMYIPYVYGTVLPPTFELILYYESQSISNPSMYDVRAEERGCLVQCCAVLSIIFWGDKQEHFSLKSRRN